MIFDFSDTLNTPKDQKKDLLFEKTSQFKIRNILKTDIGENPYNSAGGTNLSDFYGSNQKSKETLSLSIGKTLFEQHCDVNKLSLGEQNGIFNVTIFSDPAEIL